MNLTANIITCLDAVASLEKPWQELSESLSENTDFFASYAYTKAHLTHYKPMDWFIVAIYDADKLQAIFPLQRFNLTHEQHQFSACKPIGSLSYPTLNFLSGKNLGTLFISYSCGSSKGWLVQRGGRWGDVEQLS